MTLATQGSERTDRCGLGRGLNLIGTVRDAAKRVKKNAGNAGSQLVALPI